MPQAAFLSAWLSKKYPVVSSMMGWGTGKTRLVAYLMHASHEESPEPIQASFSPIALAGDPDHRCRMRQDSGAAGLDLPPHPQGHSGASLAIPSPQERALSCVGSLLEATIHTGSINELSRRPVGVVCDTG